MFKMFKTKPGQEVHNGTHVVRMTAISGNPLNPVYLHECTRCGATTTSAGAGGLSGPCRR
jgi:hypothetical protein